MRTGRRERRAWLNAMVFSTLNLFLTRSFKAPVSLPKGSRRYPLDGALVVIIIVIVVVVVAVNETA